MKMLGPAAGFARAIAVAIAVLAIALNPYAAMANWEIYNPIVDSEYWTHSNIEADGQGPLGVEYKVSMEHGSVTVSEKSGTTDATEGQWDHTFVPLTAGWPSGAKTITLWSKGAQSVFTSEDEVLIMIVEIE